MHLSLYMFYYIYTECSVRFLNSFQVCEWYLREGYSYRKTFKKEKGKKKIGKTKMEPRKKKREECLETKRQTVSVLRC